jgi:hypothetical protein
MGAKTKKALPETILKRAEEANSPATEELDL